MKPIRFCLPLVFLVVSASAFAQTPGQRQLAAVYEKWRKAFAAHDLKTIMSLYAPGKGTFAFDVVPPREFTSREAYQKDYEEFFKAFPGPCSATFINPFFETSGNMGYSHTAEDITLTDAKGNKTRMILRCTDVFRKIHGKWLVVCEHVSVPVDLDTGKPDLMSKP